MKQNYEKLEIQYVPIDKLKPSPANPRIHQESDLNMLRKSIEHFGFVNPILVQKESMRVISGHGRLDAARKQNIDHVPVIILDLNDKDSSRYMVADNKHAENSKWDFNQLREFVIGEDDGSFDISTLGFDQDALAQIVEWMPDEENLIEEPKKYELPINPINPIIKRGDLVIMDGHKLLCGDSTENEDFDRLMIDEKAEMIFTDPPYGVNYIGSLDKIHEKIPGDMMTGDELVHKLLIPAFKNVMQRSYDNAAFYIWHSTETRNDYLFAMKTVVLIEKQSLIWVKNHLTLGRSDYQWLHEECFYASKDGHKPIFYGDRAQSTVWTTASSKDGSIATIIGQGVLVSDDSGQSIFLSAKPPKGKKIRRIRISAGNKATFLGNNPTGTVWEIAKDPKIEHSTQKPAELSMRAIENSSRKNGIVLDPFAGSGSTLIGAERTGRRCFAMEIYPKYCDVIMNRWEKMTGKKAIIEKINQ